MIQLGLKNFQILYLVILDNFLRASYGYVFNGTELYGEGYGVDWIYFPDDEGVLHSVKLTMSDGDDEYLYPQTRGSHSELEYRLYSRRKKNSYTILNETAEPIASMEDEINLSKQPIKVITHGWLSSADNDAVAEIKDAYIDSYDVNVITVDWSYTASSIFYNWVANQTFTIGTELAGFLRSLSSRYKVTGDKIHLIGHSLGAHIMGIAANYSDLNIDRITGLDPARPLFEYPSRDEFGKLDSSDATFVDVIHTCSGILGIESATGTIDFFPNSGIPPQPGCETIPKIIEACSHGRSYSYFAESIRNPKAFLSYQCNGWEEYLLNRCKRYTYMGERVNRKMRGKFYLKTNSKQPYGRGNE